MLLLAAKPVDDNQRQHGNGIMYGGGRKENPAFMAEIMSGSLTGGFTPDSHNEVFFVETDFGNRMTLSWSELTRMYDVVGVRDYRVWRAERQHLIDQPPMDQDYIDG